MLNKDGVLKNIKNIDNGCPISIEFKFGFNTNKFFAYFDVLDKSTGEEFTEVSVSSYHLLTKYLPPPIN